MKKKYLVPVILALLVVLATVTAVSCGKQTDKEANATEAETVPETEPSTEAPETTEAVGTVAAVKHVPVRKFDSVYTTEAADTDPDISDVSIAPEGGHQGERTSVSDSNTPATTTPKATETKAPATPTEANKPVQTATPTQAQVCNHVWVEHKATRTEHVANMVEVPEYGEEKVCVGHILICNCGATFQNGVGAEDHMISHIMNGEDDGHWTEDVYETKTIQTGSHLEDQGYDTTVEYTDYEYCSICGERR